ncbi:hypothetical protein OG321_39220 [Streptomyces sp. NBC_00424]|uniref:hypothetical protein n=1 Tax=Streptomyces sp. NBC_00424 TaxID=2903648 RepID=UPI002253BCD5|nr:hypothetical protein [Streptomyces sp. NBC_00424]MCX5078471.1 hypothetical protein [Streptomyces sp. NBC_00424]
MGKLLLPVFTRLNLLKSSHNADGAQKFFRPSFMWGAREGGEEGLGETSLPRTTMEAFFWIFVHDANRHRAGISYRNLVMFATSG